VIIFSGCRYATQFGKKRRLSSFFILHNRQRSAELNGSRIVDTVAFNLKKTIHLLIPHTQP
jgi:hypothetical protein